MSDRLVVNEHYLNRLVEAGETRGVEATEDIVSGTGVKLVAKGAAIDARTRERLLQHKLLKPLEIVTRVVGGVATRPMDEVARMLIHRHSLLASLCEEGRAREIEGAFTSLRLTVSLESLLTLYADQAPHKLEHAVSVSLIAAALMLEVEPTRPLLPMLVAGLMHDIGELYIDPAILAPGSRMTPDQWKHVAVHPVVAASLLAELPGAGIAVAQAVLHHHERLDGFGYPRAVRQDAIPLSGQVLGLAEALTGVIESGRDAGRRAGVMLKLMGHEFDRRLLDRVSRASKGESAAEAAEEPASEEGLLAKAAALSTQLQALLRIHGQLATLKRSTALNELLDKVQERQKRLGQTLSSAGLNLSGGAMPDYLGPLDAPVRYEISVVLRELEWRVRELNRELLWRSERLDSAERDLLCQAVAQHLEPALSGTAPPAAAPAADEAPEAEAA
jgi:HD-GYP domain-containing protein (c-di-GMP phosphodiesterase class II)